MVGQQAEKCALVFISKFLSNLHSRDLDSEIPLVLGQGNNKKKTLKLSGEQLLTFVFVLPTHHETFYGKIIHIGTLNHNVKLTHFILRK